MPAEGNVPALTEPVVRLRATAVITAVWQYTAWTSCAGFSWIMLYLEYVRGAAGGAVEFYVEGQPAVYGGAYGQSAKFVGPVAINVDTASNVQRETDRYGATGAAVEGFMYGPIEFRGTLENFRVAFREVGVVGTPGQFGADVQMWSPMK